MRPVLLIALLVPLAGCGYLDGSITLEQPEGPEEEAPPNNEPDSEQQPWDLPDAPPSAPAVHDRDGDGAPGSQDCDDQDPDRAPGLPEACDWKDNDCDGDIDEGFDQDGDGVTTCGGDCDDANTGIPSGLPDVCDGMDTDCDGDPYGWEADDDFDGWLVCAGDCDDENDAINPGVTDTTCDGVDHDCGSVSWETDLDGDGFLECDGDCQENNAAVYPGAVEVCDGWDNDCNGEVDELEDTDGDGYSVCDDCNDADPTVYPNANEICDGQVNHCASGVADADTDWDGYGPCDGDCLELWYGNWESAEINPGATETCDGVDEDCDGDVDEGFDVDGDGLTVCGADGLAMTADDDCVDSDPTIPGPEVCDGFDDDCDGVADEDFDGDSDGLSTCGPDGVTGTADDDCDDADPSRRPGIVDLPGDGLDSDCDGVDAAPGPSVPPPTSEELRDWLLDRVVLARSGPTPSPGASCPGLGTTVAPPPAGSSLSPSVYGSLSGVWRTCGGLSVGGGLVGSFTHSGVTGSLLNCDGTISNGSGAFSSAPLLVGDGLSWSGNSWSFLTSGTTYMGSCVGSNTSTSAATDAGGAFVVVRAPGAPTVLDLPEGTSTVAWTRDRSSGTNWWDPAGTTVETLVLDVQTHLTASPWTAVGTASWSYSPGDGWSFPVTGCDLEPESGGFVATADGSLVEVVFDTTCDGCFTWYVDGVSQGLHCTSALAL